MAKSPRQSPPRTAAHAEARSQLAATLDVTEPAPESVSTLLSTVQRLFDDELQRGRELDTKMATLAGFSGTILALTATISTDLLALRVGGLAEAVMRVLFAVAIVSLAAAAVLAVAGALLPRPRLQIDNSAIREFASFPLIAAAKIQIEGQLLSTLIDELDFERRRNDKKATFGRFSGVALIVGFVAVAALALARVFLVR
jgi:hypothetical protein